MYWYIIDNVTACENCITTSTYSTRVIRIRKSEDRQQHEQKEKDKWTNNDLQNTTQKSKDRATRAH